MAQNGSRSSNKFLNDNESLKWEFMKEMVIDLTDGYLSNLEDTTYQTDSGDTLITMALGGDIGDEYNELASRLMKSVGRISSISNDYTIKNKDRDQVLYRMKKFVPTISKLSDQYSNYDTDYANQWHDDVIEMCEAINQVECSL